MDDLQDLREFRCPSCNSADVVRVQTQAIYDTLMECCSCKGIYPVEYELGKGHNLVLVLIEGPREPDRSRGGGL
jgi:hypothetical protein